MQATTNPTSPGVEHQGDGRLRSLVNALPPRLRRQKLLAGLCRLRVVSPIQPLRFNGNAEAWVDLRDSPSRAVYLSQSFWPELHPLVACFLRGGGELFDIGANLGLVTFGVVPLVRKLGIGFHLFEANARLVPLLERSAAGYTGETFVINHCCVSDRPGTSRLLVAGTAWSEAFISDQGVVVPNLVLDEYVAERRIQKIAFLKMDVEGWEPRALLGARRALASGQVAAGFIEVAPDSLRRTGTTPEALLEMLRDFGFDVYFAGLWGYPDARQLAWARVSVDGTDLRLAPAWPLPRQFAQADVLIVHRTQPLAEVFRRALAPGHGEPHRA
jgi:FkbM family methyltransferase